MQRLNIAWVISHLCLMTLPASPAAAQIVINEIMQNPDFVGDTEGEWFELHNAGEKPVDINGWTIRDDGSNIHMITSLQPLFIQPGGYLVLGRTTDTLLNGNVPVAYAYGSSITLGNSSDQIVLENLIGAEIDRVAYDDGITFPDPSGASMELKNSGADNSQGTSWSEAVTSWDGHDKGTPGRVNSVVDTSPPLLSGVVTTSQTSLRLTFTEPVEEETSEDPSNYVVLPGIGNPLTAVRDSSDQSVVSLTTASLQTGIQYTLTVSNVRDESGNTVRDTTLSFLYVPPPGPGDIVITEIMNDPTAVSDASGEFFEIFNTSSAGIDLQGWTISDDASNTFTISTPFVLPARSLAVFAVNADSATNGGFGGGLVYDWGSTSTFTLSNTSDKIILRSGDGTIVDSVAYDDDAGWPDTSGASIGLINFSADNNDPSQWAIAHRREAFYGSATGDLGSPGTIGSNQSQGGSGSILITPDRIDLSLGREDTQTVLLVIHNTGTTALSWSLTGVDSAEECPWLVAQPASGTIPPNDSTDLSVLVATAGLSPGFHQCVVRLSSTDPSAPVVDIPTALTVVASPVIGSVTIDPRYLPIPASGDTVPMHLTFRNLTSRTRAWTTWVEMLAPNSQAARVVLGPKTETFPPFDSLSKTASLKIPAKGPVGSYSLTVFVGPSPDSTDFASSFFFEKELLLNEQLKVADDNETLPSRPFLEQNRPNPFNPVTVFRYGLPEETRVTLRVFNLLGQEVSRPLDEVQSPGIREITWEAVSSSGNRLASGLYLYLMQAGEFVQSGKMILLK